MCIWISIFYGAEQRFVQKNYTGLFRKIFSGKLIMLYNDFYFFIYMCHGSRIKIFKYGLNSIVYINVIICVRH